MSRFIRLAVLMLMTILFMPGTLKAQTTQPADGDSAEVKAAKSSAKAFMRALGDKDVAVVKKLFAGSDEDFKLVEQTHRMFQVAMKLQAAAEAKGPAEVAKQSPRSRMDPNLMADQLDMQRFTIGADSAT